MRRSDVGAGALALLGVLGAAYADSHADSPLPEPPQLRAKPTSVRSAQLTCPPALPGDSPPARLSVGDAVLPSPDATHPPGRARVLPLRPPAAADPIATLTKPGHARRMVIRGPQGRPSATVVGRGALAAGLAATQQLTAGSGPARGMATSACLPAAARWHFVGAGKLAGHINQLVLTNPQPGVATVNLRFFGTHGPLTAAGVDGLAVAPYSVRVLDVRDLVRAQRDLSITVRATQGRVVAAVHDRWVHDLQPAGVEWLSPTSPPDRDVVVAGGLAGKGRRTLIVANPSPLEALVDVELLGLDGPFHPVGLGTLRVPPGTVLRREISTAAEGDAVSVRIRSDQPVTAALRVRRGGSGPDLAVVPASERLRGPAVLSLPAVTRPVLAIANPARSDAGGTVRAYDANGAKVASVRLNLTGGTTRQWPVPDPQRGGRPAAYVVLTPEPGADLVASAVFAGRGPSKGFLAALPLRSGLVSVRRPPVRSTLTAP